MPYSRARAVATVERWLVRRSLPRLQMFVMVVLTGFGGFAASFALLHTGIGHMWIRYPLAILVAYTLFLLMLRIWIWLANPDRSLPNIRIDDADLPSVGNIGSSRGGSSGAGFRFGGKGDFGGGGASDTFGDADAPSPVQTQGVVAGVASSQGGSGGGSSSGGGGGSIGSIDLGDDGVWIVVAIAAVLAVVLAAGYVIWVAPALFAEVLLDGLLVTRLYRRMRDVETHYWLWTAVRKTAIAVIVVMVFAGIAGYAFERITPGARSIGEVGRTPEP